MASMWWAQDNAPETSKNSNELEDLFVFGYACKTFRDDEKALYIDQGRHLIPWMGDDRLKIDRYDGRGHLYDLSAYDAANVKEEDIELSDTEKAVEAACDEERYLELRTDVAEAQLYEEEEWKRYYQSLHDGYKAVGFSYEQPVANEDENSQLSSAVEAEEDKPFVAPSELQLPKGTDTPATKKANAIVEKTAKFIAEHGAQMEIIIKTKQSGNPQFDFMHFEDRLNFYYRHMVKMIKSGKYKPAAPEVNQDDSYEDDDQHSEHGYLHPLLNANTTAPPSKPIKMPTVSVHETSYGQLIKSIKENSVKVENGSTSQSGSSRDTPPLAPPPLPPFVTRTAYNPAHPGLPPPPGTEPVVLPQTEIPYSQGCEFQYVKEEDDLSGRSTPNQIVPPPPDIQPIIDRMAMYVAKNGEEFEIVVKSKTDQRFQFLHSWHVHFPYYDFKKQMFLKEVEQERLEKEEAAAVAANKAVCFSIKTRTKEPENVAQLKKPLFDYGSSEDDNEGESDSQRDRTTETTSSSPVLSVSEPVQSSEVIPEVKIEVKSDIPVDEKKLAEERLKDRLANAAREKLAQASKEKQVQAERKRKAAMFINLLRTKPTSTDESSRDGFPDTRASTSPRGTPSNSRPSTPGVRSSQERSMPRDDYGEYDRYRRAWPIRSRSRSPRTRQRSRSRSPRARHRSRSRSPVYAWRRRRSPTPPSAFSSRRSPGRRSPPRLNIGRRRSRSRSPRRVMPLTGRTRDRSRSPKRSRSPAKKRSRSRDRKRRSKSPTRSKKRSRSRTPSSKHKKSKKSDRSPKKKKKDKDKDRDKKDKKKDKHKSKDKDKDKTKDKSEKTSDNSHNKSDQSTKEVEETKDSESENDKSDTHHSSSESDDEGSKVGERSVIQKMVQEVDMSKIEVIEIEDNDEDDIPPLPPVPPTGAPPLPPLPLTEEKPNSPHTVLDTDQSSSGRGSPALDADGKPKEVSKHLLSRVRALLKASRDQVLKEDGLDDP